MADMQEKHSAQCISQFGNPSQKLNQNTQASLATEPLFSAHVRYIHVFKSCFDKSTDQSLKCITVERC